MSADRVRVRVRPQKPPDAAENPGSLVEAEMLFEVGEELEVGYRGYLQCKQGTPRPSAP